MAYCYLCEVEGRGWNCYYCDKCNKIKRMISLYGLDRVFEILENVLVRTKKQQEYKIKKELEKEEELLESKKTEYGPFKPMK